ncbi:hypothetical protein [Sphingomonas sp. OTU376]|uniref:hypothetical protein n=1 Tax=Sphingomonas sp. OTU376 TaxID=3043863 RepID=UPI00313E4C10
MAYLDLTAERRDTRLAGTVFSPPFTELEQEVILLSRSDALNTVLPASRPVRWIRAITGARVAPPLADRRLETLRRFAVLARAGRGALLEAARSEARQAGFSIGSSRAFARPSAGWREEAPAQAPVAQRHRRCNWL